MSAATPEPCRAVPAVTSEPSSVLQQPESVSMHGVARSKSQPPPSRPPVLPGHRPESPASSAGGDDPPEFCMSPGAASNQSDPASLGKAAARAQSQPWRQKKISVAPADYYLNLLKAARGGGKAGLQAGKA